MKYREKGWSGNSAHSKETVVLNLLTGYSESGSIEQIEADIRAMQDVLTRFICSHINTVEELNELAGYDKFEEVDE